MPRPRNPKRDLAKKLWLESNGEIPLVDIAKELDVSPSQIRNWKVQDNWDSNSKVAQRNNESLRNEIKEKKHGAPQGNKNAVGNRGGSAPVGNSNAVTHGFFRKIFPDDEETHSIIEQIDIKSPLDILWENIVIQYTAIARAQRVMFVKDKEDETQVLKKQKTTYFGGDDGGSTEEIEWEYQHAWDKQANFLNAQSRAMIALQNLIRQYEDMIKSGLATEEQRLRIEKLKADIESKKKEDDKPTEIVVKRWSRDTTSH